MRLQVSVSRVVERFIYDFKKCGDPRPLGGTLRKAKSIPHKRTSFNDLNRVCNPVPVLVVLSKRSIIGTAVRSNTIARHA